MHSRLQDFSPDVVKSWRAGDNFRANNLYVYCIAVCCLSATQHGCVVRWRHLLNENKLIRLAAAVTVTSSPGSNCLSETPFYTREKA